MAFRNVLLLDPREETRENTSFLLRLAGYQVSAVNDRTEAFNWVLSRKNSPEPFAVMVISSHDQCDAGSEVANELFLRGAPLPTLIVERGAGRASPLTPQDQPGQAFPLIRLRPGELIETLRALLD